MPKLFLPKLRINPGRKCTLRYLIGGNYAVSFHLLNPKMQAAFPQPQSMEQVGNHVFFCTSTPTSPPILQSYGQSLAKEL